MPELQEEETEGFPQLVVTETMRSSLYAIGRWGKFLSTVGFVLTFLLIVTAFSIGTILNSEPELAKRLGGLAQGGGIVATATYLIVALLYFYPSLLLFQYSAAVNEGVLYGEQDKLDKALNKLTSFFKFFGILTIVLIVFYILATLALATQ